MLNEMFPRVHTRYSSLPLFGSHVEGFVVWLGARGYPSLPIRLRVCALPRIDALLRRRGVCRVEDLTKEDFLRLAPADSQDDVYLAATVRSLADFFNQQGLLDRRVATPREDLRAAYRLHLARVRCLATSTLTQHDATLAEFLDFLSFDGDSSRLRALGSPQIESFVLSIGTRLSRASLQHSVSHLRSIIRFLSTRGLVDDGLDASIDTPRLYRGERLPRALSWETVRAFLSAIDRSTPMGTRDYAIFLLIATYGLRTSEIAALRLDDIEWRAGQMRVPRPKIESPLLLPLTAEIGGALIDYVRRSRPDLPHREVFLRVRAPGGPLRPTAITEAFQCWTRRSGLSIPYEGPHCLRHSLAVHLLRQGASLKAIGDLLGHRGAESTCVYLRLHLEDLRDAALDLPEEVHP
jgi:site-specific recombinase XerD